jgi:hypothetical protein
MGRRATRAATTASFWSDALFCRAHRHLAGSAGRVWQLEQRVEAVLAAFSVLLSSAGGVERYGIWFRCSPVSRCTPCLGGGAKKGAEWPCARPLSVQSRPGQGTRFDIRFPLAARTHDRMREKTHKRQHPANRRRLRRSARDRDIAVASRLPGGDRARIIAMSGGGPINRESLLDVTVKLGADHTLAKPFDDEEFPARRRTRAGWLVVATLDRVVRDKPGYPCAPDI